MSFTSRHPGTRNTIKIRLLLVSISIGAWAFVLNSPAVAQTSGTWNTTITATGTYLWSTGTDWVGSAIPDGAGATADLSQSNLASNAVVTVMVDSNRTIGTMLISDTTSTYGNYVISSTTGATLTFDSNGGGGALIQKVASANSKTDTISVPLVLNDNLTVVDNATNAAGGLTISGSITSTGGTRNLILQGNSVSVITLSGSVNNSGSITNSGTGTGTTLISGNIGSNVTSVIENSSNSPLTLGGTNTFANLFVRQGTVSGTGSSPFGAGTITLGTDNSAANATLLYNTGASITNAIVTATNSTGTLSIGNTISTVNILVAGPITLNNSDLTFSPSYNGGSNNMNVTGNISGTGNVFIRQSGQNSMIFNTGTINMTGTLTNSGSNGNTTSIASNIGSNVTGITENSATSGMTLTGSNTGFAGAVTVSAGNLNIGGTNALNNAGIVAAIGSGGTMNLNAASSTIGGLNNFSGTGGTLSGTVATTLTLGGTGAYAFTGNITPTVPGNLSIFKTGTGSQSLTGTNNFTGQVRVNSGTLTMSTFTHSAGQAANSLISGTNLGQDSTTSGVTVGRLFFTGTPALVGTTAALSTGDGTDGNGAGAAKNTQIVPFLVGESGTATGLHGTATGVANSFLTYNATTGLRPLNLTDEYTNNAITSGNNTRITASTTNAANTSINSLVMAFTSASALTINDGFTLTDTSGAILFVNSGTIKPSTSTGTLAFGSAEGFITVNSGITGGISAPVTTSGGAITASGAGILNISGVITTSGSNLTLTNVPGAGLFTASGGIASTGSANLVLNANGAGGITLSTGTVNNQGTITNSGAGAGTTTISSVIGTNVTGINQNSATSILNLTGVANTFTGPVTAAAGTTLQIGGDGSVGNAANVISLGAGSTLKTGNNFILNHNITLNSGASVSGGTMNIAGNIIGTGAVTTTGGTTILTGNNSFGGVTMGTGGSLTITADRNLGGTSTPLTIKDGTTFAILGNEFTSFGSHAVTWSVGLNATLNFTIVDPSNTFNLNVNDNMSFNSATATTLIKNGQGTLRITAAQTTNNSSGVTYGFLGGVFMVDSPAGGSLASGRRLSFGGGGTLYILGGSNSSFTQNFGNFSNASGPSSLAAGGGKIVVDNNNSSGATTTKLDLGQLLFNGATNGSSLNIATTNLGNGSAVVTTTSTNATSGIIDARITYSPAGATTGFAAVTGTTIGAYTGGTAFVATGAVSTTNYALTGGTSGVGTETVNTLSIATSGTGQSLTQTGATTLSLATGGLLFTGSNDYTITGGTLNSLSSATSDLMIHQFGSGALTIASLIASGSGAQVLTIDGPGKVILTNTNNSYSGTTFLNGGVLSIDNINELGTSGVTFNGGTLQVTNNISTGKVFAFGSGSGGTIDIADGVTLTLTATATGSGLILNDSGVNGTGTLAISGTVGGNVSINSGILKLTGNAFSSVGTTTVSFGSGTSAVLMLNGNSVTVGGLNSSSTNAVVQNLNSGTAATLTVINGYNNTFAGKIMDGTSSAALSLVKGGGGPMVLTGSNTYTGSTTILNGVLQLGDGTTGHDGSIAGASIVNNATLAYNTFLTQSYGGAISGTGVVTKSGSGALTLSGSNSYTGATSVLNGTLKVNGSLGNTAVTVGNATTASLNPTLGGGSGTATGGVLQSLIGSATSQVYASSSTVGNIGGAVTISGTSASGSAGHLAPGNSVGTLTVGSLTLSGGSILDYEFNGTANDFTVVTGALTLNSGTAGINLYQESGTTQFATAGTYDLFQYGSLVGGVSNLSVLNPNGGFTYTFGTATSGTNNYVTLTIAASGSTTPTNYTLSVSAGTSKMLTDGSTAITTTITNTGTTGQDGLSYTGLGSTVTGGPGSVSGTTTSGSLAIQTSGSNAGNQKYVSSGSSGVVTVTAGVSSANNSTLGGAATLTGSAGTVSVSVYDPASLSFSGTGNGQTWRVSNAAATAGGLRSDAIITSATLVAAQTQAGWSTALSGTIASSGSAVAASFTPTGKLNGSYQGKLVVSAQNDQTISGASANDVLNSATTSLTATVAGNTSTSRTNVSSADVLSGQSYGTTAASSGTSAHDGTSSGYGLAISGTVAGAHTSTGNAGIPTTATLINGVASARNTVKMSLDTTAANGVTNANRTSDILTLAGLNGTNPANGQVSLTDIYVLQLTYDTSATGVEYIAWNNGSQFVNAIMGNDTGGVNGNAPTPFGTNALNESYADYLASSPGSLGQQLGAYGYYNGVAWAVLDHTGISDGSGGFQNGTNEFAVIPEPSTWGMILGGFGMLIGIQRLRKRRVGI